MAEGVAGSKDSASQQGQSSSLERDDMWQEHQHQQHHLQEYPEDLQTRLAVFFQEYRHSVSVKFTSEIRTVWQEYQQQWQHLQEHTEDLQTRLAVFFQE